MDPEEEAAAPAGESPRGSCKSRQSRLEGEIKGSRSPRVKAAFGFGGVGGSLGWAGEQPVDPNPAVVTVLSTAHGQAAAPRPRASVYPAPRGRVHAAVSPCLCFWGVETQLPSPALLPLQVVVLCPTPRPPSRPGVGWKEVRRGPIALERMAGPIVALLVPILPPQPPHILTPMGLGGTSPPRWGAGGWDLSP